MRAFAFVIVATLGPYTAPCIAQSASSDSTVSARRGVYTSEQAGRGRATYRQICANCHATSEFTGGKFDAAWANQSAFAVYRFLRDQMPLDNPGSLRPEQYVDVIAYVLQRNGFPPGPMELPTDESLLRRIRIDPPSAQEN